MLKVFACVLALVLLVGIGVYAHHHGGVTDPHGCPADEIAYYGGC
jgi:hypothetical protein